MNLAPSALVKDGICKFCNTSIGMMSVASCGIKLIEAAIGFAAISQLHPREVDKLGVLAL